MNRHLRRQYEAKRRAHLKRVRRAIRLLRGEDMGAALVRAGWTPPEETGAPSTPARDPDDRLCQRCAELQCECAEGPDYESMALVPDVPDADAVRAQWSGD